MGEAEESPRLKTTKAEEARRLGLRLRRIRELLDMTQEDLAEHIGIDPVTYSRYETGARTCPLNVVRGISELSGFPMHDFFLDKKELTGGVLPALLEHIQGLAMPTQVALYDFFQAFFFEEREVREKAAQARRGASLRFYLDKIKDELTDLGFDFSVVNDPDKGWVIWPSEYVESDYVEDIDEVPELTDGTANHLPPIKND